MSKLRKILALVLLLAIAITAFAVVPAFAADVEYGTVLWDMDVNNIDTSKFNGCADVASYTDANGQKIWTFSYDASKHQINESGSVYSVISGWGKTALRIRDVDADNPKNVDYLVIDLDIATDSELLNSFYFNSQLYTAAGARTGTGGAGRNPHFRRDENGRVYLTIEGTNSVKNKVYHPDDKGNKWVNVTLVYDFHTEGDTVTNKAYAYFDGIFAGVIDAFTTATASIDDPRLQFTASGSYSEMSTSLANLTFKTFEAGYAGPLTESGKLGSSDVNLSDLADLAYTQENCPENPEGYDSRPVIAVVSRTVDGVTTNTEIRDAKDLKNLVAGDVVTVRRSFKAAEAYGIVTRGQVTWLDYKGVNILSPAEGETPAVTIPTIFEANADADWVVLHDDSPDPEKDVLLIRAQGKAEDIYVEDSGVIIDPLYGELHASRKSYVILYDDVITYGAGPKGSTITSAKSPRYYGFDFDLNGHTLTVATVGGRHYITPQSAAGRGKPNTSFRDGTLNLGRLDDPATEDMDESLVCANDSYLFMQGHTYDGANGAIATFENLTLNVYNGSLVDQRSGSVVYRNCKITTAGMLSSVKSCDGITASLTVENCDVTLTKESLTSIKNVSEKYGSHNCTVTITDSVIRTVNHLIVAGAYPDNDDSREIEALNDNFSNISITNSEIIVTGTNKSVFVVTLGGYAADNSMNFDVNINVTGTKFSASRFLSTNIIDSEEGLTAAVNVNVNVGEGCAIKLLKAGVPGALYTANYGNAGTVISFNIADGVKLNTNKLAESDAYAIDSLILGAGESQIAHTALDAEYAFVVTASYDTYTYQLGALEAVEFYWNLPVDGSTDAQDIEVVYPAALDKVDGIYHYEWTLDGKAYVAKAVKDYGKFSAKTNLTLYDYIYFNLFINKAEYDRLADYVTVTGGKLDDETITLPDGNVYYKYQSGKIEPTEAGDTVITLALNIPTAYGESVVDNTKSFSVLDYASSLVDSSNVKSSALIKAILNYVAAACDLSGDTATADAARAIIPVGTTFADMVTDGAKVGDMDGVKIAVCYGNALYLGVKGEAGDRFTVSYLNSDENTVTLERIADANGEAFFSIKACDFANDMTITKGGESTTVNVQGYYLALDGNTAAQTMVEAIYNYAVAAAEYKASLN